MTTTTKTISEPKDTKAMSISPELMRMAVAYFIRQGNTVGNEEYPFYLSISDKARKHLGINGFARIADDVARGVTQNSMSIFTKQKVRLSTYWQINIGSNDTSAFDGSSL